MNIKNFIYFMFRIIYFIFLFIFFFYYYILLLNFIIIIYLLKIRLDVINNLFFNFIIKYIFYNLLSSKIINSLNIKNSILFIYILTILKAFSFIIINK